MLCSFAVICFPPCPGAQESSEKKPSNQSEAAKTPENVSEEKQPHLTLDAATYDVGDIYEGETVSHSFKVKNTGTAELTIKDVRAG